MAKQAAKLGLGTIAGPDALVNVFKPLAASFQPAAARLEVGENAELWQLYLDLFELDGNKIKDLVYRHGGEADADESAEPEAKYKIRQSLAVVFNLIPSIIGMVGGYLFAEEPQLDSADDPEIKAFFEDCNGQGQPFKEWIRLNALPMSLVLGWVDVLVQNPMADGGGPITKAQADAERVKPRVHTITPMDRVNWSANAGGDYNWIRFSDPGDENPDPLATDPGPGQAYITISRAVMPYGMDKGFWIRSWVGEGPEPDGGGQRPGVWMHEVNYTPVQRCAVATLYYRQSIDPKRRHFGVSKIAMMAILTRCILNVLSWTTEDMLANLAILALPSSGGRPPKDEKGNDISPQMNPFTILYYDKDGKSAPLMLQGAVAHIEVKMEFVATLVNEILRLAHMTGVSAEAEKVQSGVQGLVMRNELFQELAQLAGGLDDFGYSVLALVKSWATGEDWTVEKLRKETKVNVNFHKGPYTLDPLKDVIANAKAMVGMYRQCSPTVATAALKYAARAYLYANDPNLDKALKEIDKFGGDGLALLEAAMDANQIGVVFPGEFPDETTPPGAPATPPGQTAPGNSPAGGVAGAAA